MTTTGVSSSSDVDESNNPYLALRAAKIARNEARLRELGLLKTPPQPATNTTTAAAAVIASLTAASTGVVAAYKRKADAPAAAAAVDRSNLRRSKRHAAAIIVTPDPHSNRDVVAGLRRGKQGTTPRKRDEQAATSHEAKTSLAAATAVEIAPLPPSSTPILSPACCLAPNSARAMHLNVAKLVVSTNKNDHDEGLLGHVMAKTGKTFVMEESARLAAENHNNSISSSSNISFNKYSGVQEWADALFLWINLGAPNCDVINEFLDEGRRVTWFGGSRMHEKTRAIQRLMHEGDTSLSSSSTSCIVLWCRRYQPTCKTFTPYTCMGRLGYHSHTAGSRPLAFCWNLIDYDRLVQHADEKVRQNFASMIGC